MPLADPRAILTLREKLRGSLDLAATPDITNYFEVCENGMYN